MGIETKGFDELIKKLENMAEEGNRIAKSAVEKGAEIVLEAQRKDAPNDTGEGAKNLSIGEIKKYKTGVYAKIGITKDNWEQTKHLYFQHFGYYNKGWKMANKPKLVVKRVGWMNESFKKIEDKARDAIIDEVKNIVK